MKVPTYYGQSTHCISLVKRSQVSGFGKLCLEVLVWFLSVFQIQMLQTFLVSQLMIHFRRCHYPWFLKVNCVSNLGNITYCLRFVSPCIIVQFRYITNQMQQFSSLLSWRLFTVQHVSGRFPAHHQELNDCSGNHWFYLRIVVTVVLCSWSGRPARPRTQHGYHHDDGWEKARNMLICK